MSIVYILLYNLTPLRCQFNNMIQILFNLLFNNRFNGVQNLNIFIDRFEF